MKKIILLVLCIALLLISCNKENKKQDNNTIEEQTENVVQENERQFNKTMYVNASSGLRVRSIPSTDGEVLGRLENSTEVNIVKEVDDLINLDGVEGRWVYISTPFYGWVFDGYLSYDYPDNPLDNNLTKYIIGRWDEVMVTEHYEFNKDKTFINSEYIGASTSKGTYEIKGNNKILLHYDYFLDHSFWNSENQHRDDFVYKEPERIVRTRNAEITIISNDMMKLKIYYDDAAYEDMFKRYLD